jgi:hypothetical protein
MEDAFILPPRQETILARYSRRSKFSALLLMFIGLAALSYVAGRTASSDTA